MLSPQEEAELAALEQEFAPQAQSINMRKAGPSRSPGTPARGPGDLTYIPFSALSPEEEAELAALEAEFAQRPVVAPMPTSQGVIEQVGSVYDRYSGSAAARKAVGDFIDTGSLAQAGSGFINQYGADPAIAPTGKELAEKMGLSAQNQTIPRNPMAVADEARAFKRPGETIEQSQARASQPSEVASPAAMVGFGLDVALDPINALPFVPVAKAGGKVSAALRGSAAAAKDAAKAADNFATGGKLVRVADVAGGTGKFALESAKQARIRLSKLFKPDVAPDFDELKSIAEANGVDTSYLPESIEFGENSTISRFARSKAEGPLGGDALQKFEKFGQDVSKAAENKVLTLAKTSRIPGKQEAGRILREGYDEGVDNFFKQMDVTYNSAVKMAPGMRFDVKSSKIVGGKLDAMEKWALGRLGSTKHLENTINTAKNRSKELNSALKEFVEIEGSTNKAITKTQQSQAQEVLRAVKLAKNALNKSGGDLEQVVSAMRDIGEVAFKSKNSLAEIPSDVRKFQEMYFTLQKGVTESIRTHLGDDIADALVKNNSEMSKHFTERGVLTKAIGNKNLADENVFESLVMRGDSKQLQALQKIIPEQKFNEVRAAFLDNLMVRNADGTVLFASTRKKLNGMKDKLKNVFSEDELLDLDDVLRLGDRAGVGVLSTSGTGGSIGFKNIKETLESTIANDTLMESMKKGARNRKAVSVPYQIMDNGQAIQAAQAIRPASQAAPGKTGLQLLLEGVPKTKSAQGAKVYSNQKRNERLEQYKKLRGL
jgi:hypothetical protein